MVRTALGPLPAALAVPDGPVVAVLRPEQCRLAGDGDASAAVTAHRFYGPDSVVRVALDDGTTVMLRCPGDVSVTVGQRVTVRVDGAVLAYPAAQLPASAALR